MNRSDSIQKLSAALCAFQAEITNPKHSAENPFYKSSYTPLHDVINHVRPILAKHGLAVLQNPSGDGDKVVITTLLMHSSGEWVETDPLVMKGEKLTPQGAGAVITYGRRYSLSAVLGIASEDDDDGNGAEKNPPQKQQRKPEPKPREPQKPADQPPEQKQPTPLKPPQNDAPPHICHGCGEPISEKVESFSKQRFGKPLCMECQKGAKGA